MDKTDSLTYVLQPRLMRGISRSGFSAEVVLILARTGVWKVVCVRACVRAYVCVCWGWGSILEAKEKNDCEKTNNKNKNYCLFQFFFFYRLLDALNPGTSLSLKTKRQSTDSRKAPLSTSPPLFSKSLYVVFRPWKWRCTITRNRGWKRIRSQMKSLRTAALRLERCNLRPRYRWSVVADSRLKAAQPPRRLYVLGATV